MYYQTNNVRYITFLAFNEPFFHYLILMFLFYSDSLLNDYVLSNKQRTLDNVSRV